MNGIAILNLKHLASVLDLITGPVIAKSQPDDNTANVKPQDLQDENNTNTCVEQELCYSVLM